MQSISIICVGKLKEKFYLDAVSEYAKRLSAFCALTITELAEVRLSQEPSNAEISAALSKEADEIRKKIPKGAYVAAMCVEGKALTSEDFSNMIMQSAQRASKLCFIIGSSFGLDAGLKQEADERISMSKMTFPHHLARVMLLEQIYRGFGIAAGSRYHK